MEITPKIFIAKVMHKRMFPKVNMFVYKVFYLFLPLSWLQKNILHKNLAINKAGIISFYYKDHINKQQEPKAWIEAIINEYNIQDIVAEVVLVSMPRILGYSFNPISLWLCLDKENKIRAVLSEVNNTFGETHCYFCMLPNGEVISSKDWLEVEKLFHVSPFIKREGFYRFRFVLNKNNLGVWINYYNTQSELLLTTSLIGKLKDLTKKELYAAFFSTPLVTFKTIFLIHYQALKLIMKGIKHITKPLQGKKRFSKNK